MANQFHGDGLHLVTLDIPCRRSNGEVMMLPYDYSGVRGGWAYIGFPWDSYHDGYWKIKDGDTVLACSIEHPCAMPVADAYYEFREAARLEQEYWDAEYARWEAEDAAKQVEREASRQRRFTVDLTADDYEIIEERLMGV